MKKFGMSLTILLLLITTCFAGNLKEEKIRILSSPDSYELSVKLANQYNLLKGTEKIEIVRFEPGKQNALSEGNLYFLSGQEGKNYDLGSSWKIVVARDVIVPVINSGSPFINEILHKGIPPSKLAKLIMNGNQITWGNLLDDKNDTPARICFVENERTASSIAEFLDADVQKISGKRVHSQSELFDEMKKDPSLIGICRLVDILDPGNQVIREGIALLPIDRDENGIIDHTEDIYTDYSAFNRGVWIGKYPRALFSNIYSVSAVQPDNEEAKAFLKWVLADGQKFIPETGYTDLIAYESQANTEKLIVPVMKPAETAPSDSVFRTLLVVVAFLIAAGFLLDFLVRLLRKPEKVMPVTSENKVLDESQINLPGGLYFDKTHTWAFMEVDGLVRVGIDDFLHHVTGPLTKIRMKTEGDKVKKGEEILSVIRNGKQLNLYAPVSGTIEHKNRNLESDISKLNTAPYTDGWVYTVRPDNWSRENQLLLKSERQREFIKGEISRLKDFFSNLIPGDMHNSPLPVHQDGGALLDGPLADMEPVVWEEFQSKFIDPSRQVWFYELF